jgi:hypothetical protein
LESRIEEELGDKSRSGGRERMTSRKTKLQEEQLKRKKVRRLKPKS